MDPKVLEELERLRAENASHVATIEGFNIENARLRDELDAARSPAIRLAQCVLVALEARIAVGEGDGEEADSLRERCSDLIDTLSEEGQQRITELAEDLDLVSAHVQKVLGAVKKELDAKTTHLAAVRSAVAEAEKWERLHDLRREQQAQAEDDQHKAEDARDDANCRAEAAEARFAAACERLRILCDPFEYTLPAEEEARAFLADTAPAVATWTRKKMERGRELGKREVAEDFNKALWDAQEALGRHDIGVIPGIVALKAEREELAAALEVIRVKWSCLTANLRYRAHDLRGHHDDCASPECGGEPNNECDCGRDDAEAIDTALAKTKGTQ